MKVIVEAAARILEERGHAAFSTNAVAERAGVSIGSLYQYFPSKDALMGALILRETSLLFEDAEAAAAQSRGKAALGQLIAACVSHQLRRPQLARLLDFEEARLPFDGNTQRFKKQIEKIVRRMLGCNDLPRQRSLRIASRDIVAVIKGIVDSAGLQGETDQKALAARVRRAVFGYLGVSRATSAVKR